MKYTFKLFLRIIFIVLFSMLFGSCDSSNNEPAISSPFGPKKIEKIIITFEHKLKSEIELPEGVTGSTSPDTDPLTTEFKTPIQAEGKVTYLELGEMPVELRDTELDHGILATRDYGNIDILLLGLKQGEPVFELQATPKQELALKREIIKYQDNKRDLFNAIIDDDISKLKELINAKVDLNVRSIDEITPLIAAVIMNNAKAARILLAANADVNARDQIGWTALIHSASADAGLELVNELIEAHADINACDIHGTTALIVASVKGNMDLVKALLKAGADLNATANNEGESLTALNAAEREGHMEVADFLRAWDTKQGGAVQQDR